MLEVSSHRASRRKKSSKRRRIIVAVLCAILLLLFPLTNSKVKKYNEENNKLKAEIEKLES